MQMPAVEENDTFPYPSNIIIFGSALLFSLLIMRIMTSAFPDQAEAIPLWIILGFAIFFNTVIPIPITYFGLSTPNLHTNFIVPFIIRAGFYPLFDAILLGHITLIFYPDFITARIIDGIGLGIIGCGGYFRQDDRILSLLCMACGVVIIIMSSPNCLNSFLDFHCMALNEVLRVISNISQVV